MDNYNTLDQSSIPNRPIQIFKQLTDHYNNRIRTLVYLLYKKGATLTEIAEELNISRQALHQQFPKGVKK